jgi:4-hydroxy-3-polyprenylbenzoate decarboxylase
MKYKNLKDALIDLEKIGELVRIPNEVDGNLVAAQIHRIVQANKGPAILFEKIKGSAFPAASNIFGTSKRTNFLFRSTSKSVRDLIAAKSDPSSIIKKPSGWIATLQTLNASLPRKISAAKSPVAFGECKISDIPQIQSWPMDGGAFVTLPQVFSMDPTATGWRHSNMGMYRIQLMGNQYKKDKEIGLHYQIHRGIASHHQKALQKGEELKVSIFIGGPPAHTFAAVMPLPQNLPELAFAGALSGNPFQYAEKEGHILSSEADFCIVGRIKGTLPEGPFGDHLGYYSLVENMPYMEVDKVYHREDAIYPFTVVSRPPAEDSYFGEFIHTIVGDAIQHEIDGVKAVHAVDESGVHPLLLAIGSERYLPYGSRVPMEILTQANGILGYGQMSLAKYLFITATEDAPELDIHDTQAYFKHVLERIRFEKDLHFQTCTTIDTLDYSSKVLNEGSKLVIAVAGEKQRQLCTSIPKSLNLSEIETVSQVNFVMDGILAFKTDVFSNDALEVDVLKDIRKKLETQDLSQVGIILLCDDSEFISKTHGNFLWATFTRSNPSHDISGVGEFTENKHWGCTGPIIIDIRIKPHHAPGLTEDPKAVAEAHRIIQSNPKLNEICKVL